MNIRGKKSILLMRATEVLQYFFVYNFEAVYFCNDNLFSVVCGLCIRQSSCVYLDLCALRSNSETISVHPHV